MVEQIQLLNPGRRPFTGTLYHDSYCLKGGQCGCRQERFLQGVRNKATGETGHRVAMRSVPVGVSIAPGEQSVSLTRAVRKVPGFAEAIRVGRLVMVPAPSPAVRVRKVPLIVPISAGVKSMKRSRRETPED